LVDRRTIGVISGGDSPEREVSLISGREVSRALKTRHHKVVTMEIASLDDLVPKLRGVDLAFNCLHGGSGEDGTVQLLLEVLGISYPGSGPQASALCMDKLQSKAALRAAGLMVPNAIPFSGEDEDAFRQAIIETLGLPIVLKPQCQGSSIGVRIVDEAKDLEHALSQIASEAHSFFAEEYIPGRELTIGILTVEGKDRVLPVVEMRPKERFFDYQAKYTEGRTEFLVPAPLDEQSTLRAQQASLSAHRALGCRGFSRVDLRLREDGLPFILEVNTLPGMTPMSDLPRAAAADGISFPELVEMMLKTAFKEEPL
jgi:D-alanine-D-alanine ligase